MLPLLPLLLLFRQKKPLFWWGLSSGPWQLQAFLKRLDSRYFSELSSKKCHCACLMNHVRVKTVKNNLAKGVKENNKHSFKIPTTPTPPKRHVFPGRGCSSARQLLSRTPEPLFILPKTEVKNRAHFPLETPSMFVTLFCVNARGRLSAFRVLRTQF